MRQSADVVIRTGGVVIPADQLTSADQETVIGDGTARNPLHGGSIGPDGPTPFRYVATGDESNPFTVTLPTARASSNYNVQVTMGGPSSNNFRQARALVDTFATTEFDVETTSSPQAGDVFMFTVQDLA